MPLDLNWLFAYPKLKTMYENLRMAQEMFPYELEYSKQRNMHQNLTNQALQQSIEAILREQQKQIGAENVIKDVLDKIEGIKNESSLLEGARSEYEKQLKGILEGMPALPQITTNIGGADTTDAILSERKRLVDEYVNKNKSDVENILDNIKTINEAYKTIEGEKKTIQSGVFSKDTLGSLLPYTKKENMINVILDVLEKLGKNAPLKVFAPKDILSQYGLKLPENYLGGMAYVDENMRPIALAEAPKKMEYKEITITPQQARTLGVQLPKGFEKYVTEIKGYQDDTGRFIPTDYGINTSLESIYASMASGQRSDLLDAAKFIEMAERNKFKNAIVSVANRSGIQLPNTDDVNTLWQVILANQNRVNLYDIETLKKLYEDYTNRVEEVEELVAKRTGFDFLNKKPKQRAVDYLKSKVKGVLNE